MGTMLVIVGGVLGSYDLLSGKYHWWGPWTWAVFFIGLMLWLMNV